MRIQRLDFGTGGIQRLLGALEIGAAGGIALVHVFLALEILLCQHQRRLFGCPLRTVRRYLFLRFAQIVALSGVVDIGNQLPLFNGIAHLHMQLLDLAADLRAHIDQLRGLNGTGCQHGVFNIPALDRCGDQRRAGRLGKPDFVASPQQKQQEQDGCCEPPRMGFEFFPHSERDALLLEMKR